MKQIIIYAFAFLLPLVCMAQWNQIGQNILGDAAGDRSGVDVSISHDSSIIAIGAFDNDVNGVNAGQVKILKNVDGDWVQIGQDLYGDAAGDGFGRGVSLNSTGNIIAIGAFEGTGVNGMDSGHVKVFENIGGTWTQIGQTIEGAGNDDEFGFQLSINNDGTIVAIGARSNDANINDGGHARIFENVNGVWTQIGQDINGTEHNGSLGSKISLSGDGSIVAISAIFTNQARGHVEVHKNIGGVWTQIGQNIDGEATNDLSGQGLAISDDGNTVAIGSRFNDSNGDAAGHVRVFKNVNENWVQAGQELVGAGIDDNYGGDVALSNDGTILAVAAEGFGISSISTGYCAVYRLENNNWAQVNSLIYGNQNFDRFNYVALSANGGTIVIGSTNNGQEAGITRIYGNALLSVEENSFASEVVIYPNPVVDNSTISLGKRYNNVSMEIFNMNGSKVMSKTFTNTKSIQIDASQFASGIYSINLVSNKEKASIKMIKR